MPFIYEITSTDPNPDITDPMPIKVFPDEIQSTDWYKTMRTTLDSLPKTEDSTDYHIKVQFDTEEDLNNWLSLAEVPAEYETAWTAWKTEHNIVFETKHYEI